MTLDKLHSMNSHDEELQVLNTNVNKSLIHVGTCDL